MTASSSRALDTWVRWASQRLGKKLSDLQVEMYVEEMLPWELDQEELIRLERVIRRRSEGFWPTCFQLRDYALRVHHKPETEPIFRTYQDREGRQYAKPTRYRREVVPDEETLERWKAEKASPEEAREIWNRQFFLVTGALPEDPSVSGVPVAPEQLAELGLEKNAEKKILTAESEGVQSAGYADRADFDPGPESFQAEEPEFEFSGVEVEYVDETPEPGSPFDEL